MSSLLQFTGSIKKGKVGLQFVWADGRDTHPCSICGQRHDRIYIAYRKPLGLFGHWVVFRYNNEEHVPDLSIPISISPIPRDAKPLSDTESSKEWH